jgi:hypothetical protein
MNRWQVKYCSNKCQLDAQYNEYIDQWKNNKKSSSKNISKHIKKYFLMKYGERCSICKWNKRHTRSGNVPLEIDHLDGNAQNNNEKNLRLLCPNCHALTSNFKNFNKGHGRTWRTNKNPIM